jgi:FkbM family methyltransferase
VIDETVVEQDGLKWGIRPNSDDHLAVNGHEAFLAPILRALCPEGGLFIDIGAHVGTWAIRMHHWGRKVTAAEANPHTFKQLLHNCDMNNVVIDLFQAAAWDSWTTIDLWDENELLSGGSTEARTPGSPGRGKKITTARAMPAEVMVPPRTRGKCLIKIDVEGQEQRVLKGLGSVWRRKELPNLLIELHGNVVEDDELDIGTIRMVRDLGYHIPSELPEWGACTYLPAQPLTRVSDPS